VEEMEQKKSRRGLKHGAYTAGISAVVIAIVIVLNMVVGQLPTNLTQFDISNVQLYSISDTSKEVLSSLQHDVQIVVLAQDGNTDERITKFLDNYAALSNHITVTKVDPVAYPSALTTYDATENSLVVICKDTGKQTSIPYTDIIQYDSYSYYTTGQYTETAFDAEGQLTTAVDYVTGDTSEKVYQLNGHDETALSDTVLKSIKKSNISVGDDLNLLLTGAIPDDCSLLICNAPTSDLASDELTLLQNYLQGGGQLMILFGETDSTLTNFETLMTEYGMQMADGYIADTGNRHYQDNYYYVFPEYNSDSSLVSSFDSDKDLTLMINSHGMTQVTPARDSITVEPFLQTSDSGVAVGTDQVNGTYILGAVATEEGGGRLTVIGSSYLIDESIISKSPNLYNLQVFMNAVTGGFENASNISIPAKSLETTYNTIANAGLWSMIFVVIIPVATLAGGLIYWIRRRKR
jgi:ABC-2 type transport system permease protein